MALHILGDGALIEDFDIKSENKIKNNIEEIYYLKLDKVKRILSELTKLNIDTSKYKDLLDSIQTDFENDKNNLKLDINKLDELLEELKQYDSIFSPYYASKSINYELNKKDIDNNKLDELVKLTISLLSKINIININEYSNVKSVIEYIYSVAYQVMKLEFRFYSKSKIFDYAKNNEVIKEYMNRNIETDLERYTNDNNHNKIITTIINELKSQGLEYDYFNEMLITYLDVDNNTINGIKKGIESINERIEEIECEIEDKNNEISDAKNKLYYSKKSANKNRLKASILSLATFLSFYLTAKLGTYKEDDKFYKAKYETYSQLTGETKITYDETTNPNDEVTIKIYSPYKDGLFNKKRKVKEPIMNESEIKDIEEYLKMDLDGYGYLHDVEKTKVLGENDDYTDYFRTVTIKTTDKDNYEVRTVEKHTNLSLLILILLFVVVPMTEAGLLPSDGILASIYRTIKNDIESGQLKIDINKINMAIEEEKKLIENYEEVRNELFEKYKLLLEDDKENLLRLKK